MARTSATHFSGALQFPIASAATDLVLKEDIQTLALAVDQHNHTTGKGLPIGGLMERLDALEARVLALETGHG